MTWEYQDRALPTMLDCIETGRDLVIEKSRDMGASWMCLLVMEWLWHFHMDYSFLIISREEDLVDKRGDPDSLFWKIDFVHRNLPGWLMPPSYDPGKHRIKLHFENPQNNTTIDGDSTTGASGVGGRRTAIFIDEFSRFEKKTGEAMLAGTADTTDCRIFNFTPFGTNNASFQLAERARRGAIRSLRFHWADHPEKRIGLYKYDQKKSKIEVLDKGFFHGPDYNFILDGKLRSLWYDAQCARRANDREMAMMVDIDYQGAQYQFFMKTVIDDLIGEYACHPYWEGEVSFDPDSGQPRELIQRSGGPLKLWVNLDSRGRPPLSKYGGGLDLSAGTGTTNSCLSFVDSRTGEKVLEFADPWVTPDKLAPMVCALCRLFKSNEGEGCKLAWESVGPGAVFSKRFMDLGYLNVYYRTSESTLSKTVSDTPGWFPSGENKRLLLEEYRTALSSRRMVNRSQEALAECLDFIHTGKTVEHSSEDISDPTGARENHGDRVIADALAWKMACLLGADKPVRERPPEITPSCLAYRRQLSENAEEAT